MGTIKKDEKEYIVGHNRTTLIEGNIIYVIANGEQTPKLAKLQAKVNSVLTAKAGGKINYLIDLNNCGKNSPEARRIWKGLSDNVNTSKVAVFGIHPVARILTSFVFGLSPKTMQRFFATKEEALIWLKEKD